MFEKILICLDGSSLAEQILPYAAEQALRFNSKVVLLQVLDVPSTIAWIQGAAPDTDIRTEDSQTAARKAGEYLESISESLRAKGLDAKEEVIHHLSADQAIVDYAVKNGVDLIAITTRGRSGMVRTLLGSVADFVLRESSLPILVIRPR